MNEKNNFIVYHMPGMLGTVVTMPDPIDSAKRIRDEAWYEDTRQKMSVLFNFFKEKDLLRKDFVLPAIDEVVLRIDDFSELGRKFVMSQAPDNWLASFDRPGSKKAITDVTYLAKKLEKLMK